MDVAKGLGLLPFSTQSSVLSPQSLSLQSWIERVAQAVVEEVDGEEGQGDRDAGRDHEPGGVEEIAEGIVEHVAPSRCRDLHAEAEVGERRLAKDSAGDVEADQHQDDRADIRQDMEEEDTRRARTGQPGRIDIITVA